MKTLAEQLCERSGKELFLMASRNKLLPLEKWPEEAQDEIQQVYYSSTDNDEYYLHVLKNWEEGEYEPFDESDPADEEEAEVRRYQMERMERALRIGRKLREIEGEKAEYAAVLADMLLESEEVRRLLTNLQDPAMEMLRDIISGQIAVDEEGFYPIDSDPEHQYVYERLETYGYARIRKISAYDSVDDREHITGISFTDEVLWAVQSADSEEMEAERNRNVILNQLERIVSVYYELVPLDFAQQLYSILRQKNLLSYPEWDTEQLEKEVEAHSQQDPGALYRIIPYRGRKYFYNCTTDLTEDMDEETEETSYEAWLISLWKEPEIDPYLPSLEEMENYLEYGFFETRKPFRDLRKLIREFYEDEKAIEGMTGSLFMIGMNEEERDGFNRRRHYSLNLVEEKTDELFIELCMNMGYGMEPGEIYKENKDFTCALNDSAKRRLRRLLTKCCNCCPKPDLLGNSEEDIERITGG